MAAHIVDVLEAVEIDEQHRSAQPTLKHAGKGLIKPIAEQPAVRQTCQAIVQRQVDDPRVGALALSYVSVGSHNAAGAQGVRADLEGAAIGADLLIGPINTSIVRVQ